MLKRFHLVNLVILISLHYVYSYNVDVLMPKVSPTIPDTYLCYKFKIDNENPMYITEFIPNSKKEIAHHILMFGCDEPGRKEDVWNCGEMHATDESDEKYKKGSVCRGYAQSIIYAWAMDAPKLVLPKDVAFKVGPGTNVKYIVLQVHYADVESFKHGATDSSGVTLVAQDEPVPNTAGVYLLSTQGYIKAGTKDYFEAACEIRQNIVMHPFAFRTHAHKLGLVTSGYRVKYDENGDQEWTEIGRRSPQLPQMFYPATNQAPIAKGDVVAARCTMNNFVDHDVHIGSTGEDEMCNFYMMYYVEGDKLLDSTYCTTAGPPNWYFKDFRTSSGKTLDLRSIPKTASEIPESNEKPVNHNMNHNQMPEDHKAEQTIQQNSNESEEDDEDVEFLNHLEEDLFLRKLLYKALKQN